MVKNKLIFINIFLLNISLVAMKTLQNDDSENKNVKFKFNIVRSSVSDQKNVTSKLSRYKKLEETDDFYHSESDNDNSYDADIDEKEIKNDSNR